MTTMVGQITATLVAGYIVSRGVNRAHFVAYILALGSSNLILFLHATFHTLILLRLIIGIAQGAIIPVVFSMAADMFAPVDRPSAAAILSGAVGAGMLSGQIFAGFMDGVLTWREQIGATGLLSLALMCWVLTSLVDPSDVAMGHKRKTYNKSYMSPERPSTNSAVEKAFADKNKLHPDEACCSQGLMRTCATPTVALLLLQSAPSTIPWGVLGAFLIDFLTHEAAMRMDVATSLMAAFGAGAAIGGIGGGLVGTELYKRPSKKLFCVFIGVATILGGLGTKWMIRNGVKVMTPSPNVSAAHTASTVASTDIADMTEIVANAVTDLVSVPGNALDPEDHEARHMILAALAVLCCGILSAINGPNIKAMFLNLSPPAHRASLIGWANFLNCVGRGIGPLLAKFYIVRQDVPRQNALEASIDMWTVSGVVLIATAFTVDKDIFKGMAAATVEPRGVAGKDSSRLGV